MNIWKMATDIQTADMLKLPVPEVTYTTITTEASEFQKEMILDLADRADVIRHKLIDPQDDNMLKVTGEGRKLALDQRLQNPNLPDDPNSKINKVVENTLQIYEKSTEKLGTQLIFCDQSTPKGDGTFNVYDDIRNKLVDLGIPKNEIAFIHECKNDEQKAKLFKNVREGKVRVLLGSTEKLGTGTNFQTKLVALHHVDCPWKPSAIEQRDGRIVRQGNTNPNVEIFKYVTKSTFDAYSWALIEAKQKFIGQVFTSKTPVRSADDVDDTALSYGEVKALATGDERIKEKMELDVIVIKLKSQRSTHLSELFEMQEKQVKTIPLAIKTAEERISKLEIDLNTAKENPITSENFNIILDGVTYTERKTAGEVLNKLCKEVEKPKEPIEIGEFRGFPIELSFTGSQFKVEFKGEITHDTIIEEDPVGNMKRLDNCVEGISEEIENLKSFLEQQHKELEVIKEEITKPFPHEAEYQAKTKQLAKLNKDLANIQTPPRKKVEKEEEKKEEKPSVLNELKKIKQDGEAKQTSESTKIKGKLDKVI